uniref:Uncharacterized protein n=1 Tax=Panagrolaimus sp. ES5 TaxID=591445 RepID=A0AC34FJ83_9BILA
MAFSPSSQSQFSKSNASNFAASRTNLLFSTSQLPPPQLPFQLSGHPSSMLMRQGGSSSSNVHGMAFSSSRFPTALAPQVTTFHRDEEYEPNPILYGNWARMADSYNYLKLEQMILDRSPFQN